MYPNATSAGSLRISGLHLLQRIESIFDRPFGAACNPWRHLGALAFFFFWVVAASGIYLYIAFDTSVTGVYRSIDHLTGEQWYFGGIVRSFHRYASDAFVVLMVLHLIKEYLYGRYNGFRWFSWVTGVPLLWFAFAGGIDGYWLVWDKRAQFSAIATAEWLDWLPLFAEPLVRNFLTPDSVNDRLFSLLIFLHIAIPLFLLLGMWIHVQRIKYPTVNPPRVLVVGSLLMLFGLALIRPAASHAPAGLSSMPGELSLDWFFLFIPPLMYATSAATLWALLGGATLLLLLAPLHRPKAQPVAEVNLDNCNGCGRCALDCPYAAIIMRTRTDGKQAPREAMVLPDLCASCGICAGACPSSTPFRSMEDIVTGIDMPQLRVTELRDRLEAGLASLSGDAAVVVFGCECAADVAQLAGPDTAVFSVLCTGMLPPSFIEYSIRGGAGGVMVTGCVEHDCAYRLGNQWMESRIRGEREPHLRKNIPDERVRVVWAGGRDLAELERQLRIFREALDVLPSQTGKSRKRGRSKKAASYG